MKYGPKSSHTKSDVVSFKVDLIFLVVGVFVDKINKIKNKKDV